MRRGGSLRSRVVVVATAAVALVLVAAGWLLTSSLQRALTDELARGAVLRSRDLAALAAQGALPRPIPVGDADEALVQVVVGADVVSSSANAADAAPLAVPAPPAGATRVTDLPSLPIATDEDDGAGGFVVAATSIETPSGVATVYVAASREDVVEALAAATRLGLVALPALVAVLGWGVWLLVGRTLAPVDAIRAEADAITGSDLHRRVPEPTRGDEIGRLARTLNRMLDRIEGAAAGQRRFVADAAHELRTPVTSIRAALETARDSTRPIDWSEVSGDVLTDAIRMQDLIEQLLLLARVDEGGIDVRFRDIDLDDLVERVVDDHRAGDRVAVVTTAVEPVRVVGEPVLLASVVANLLDNAVAHARSRVEIALRRVGTVAVLVVDDDGPGIPAEQRAAAFERFTRLDDARVHGPAGGAGLGLAIVADVVDLHGGTVEVDDGPSGGARFRVRLPLDG